MKRGIFLAESWRNHICFAFGWHSKYPGEPGMHEKLISARGRMHKTLSRELCELLSQRGMSQAQFAEHVGVTPKTVCEWASGKTEPQLAAVKLLRLEVAVRGLIT